MSRFVHLRSLAIAGALGICVALACRAASPSEAPPLGPRPEPVQPNPNPVPAVPDKLLPGPPGPSTTPVDAEPASPLKPPPPPTPTTGGAGTPGGVHDLRGPEYRASASAQPPVEYPAQTPVDAGGYNPPPPDATPFDAGFELPPDAVPLDASRESIDAFSIVPPVP